MRGLVATAAVGRGLVAVPPRFGVVARGLVAVPRPAQPRDRREG
jgi:hypothetical protein